jgi:hypothetical protein
MTIVTDPELLSILQKPRESLQPHQLNLLVVPCTLKLFLPPLKKARTCTTHHKALAADAPGSVLQVFLPTVCVSPASAQSSKAFTSYILNQIEIQA